RVGHITRGGRAPCRAGLLWRTGPGAPADDERPAARVDPGRGVARGPAIVLMPAIGHPLTHVPGKIVQAPCIGREASHRRRSPVAIAVSPERVGPAARARRTVTIAGKVARALGRAALPPGEGRGSPGTERIFELGLAGQPVAAAGLRRPPVHVRLRVL